MTTSSTTRPWRWALAALALTACSSGAHTPAAAHPSVDARPFGNPRLVLSAEPYALVIEFGSNSDPMGADQEAGTRLEAIVRATQPPIARTTTSLGSEGEREVCFTLKELPAAQRAALIERVRREVGSGRSVTVKVDARCRLYR
jgi:zona occludens toxin (predicted ATPase)